MEITVESNGGAQEHQPNRFFFFNQTGWAFLIFSWEKQLFWQLLIIKISVTTTFPGLVVSQGTAPCGRTWFHSGPPTTLSKKQNPLKLCLLIFNQLPTPYSGTSPPTRCPTRWSTTSSGLSQRLSEASMLVRLKAEETELQTILIKLWLLAY